MKNTKHPDYSNERAVVGAALKDRDSFIASCRVIRKAEMFSLYAHQVVWRTLYRMHREGHPWEPNVCYDLLVKQKEVKDVRADYIAELWELATPHASPYYAKMIVDSYVRRRTLEEVDKLRSDIADPGEAPLVMLERVKRSLDDVGRDGYTEATDDQGDKKRVYEQFPIEDLPVCLREYIQSGSEALHCDPAFLAVPSLVVLASVIGSSRIMEIKASWPEPCVVWAATVADSSSMKSPSLDMALAPLWEIQRGLSKDYENEYDYYRRRLDEWRRKRNGWKKGSEDDDKSDKPDEPRADKLIVSDITIEKLGHVMWQNPGGVVLVRDELSGWFASFGRYADGKGPSADLSNWLSIFGARSLIVDRKSGDPPSFTVERAACSVVGTIQPTILKRILTTEFFESGLTSRLLLAMPERRPKVWTEEIIPEKVYTCYSQCVRGIYDSGREHLRDTDNAPKKITFNRAAKNAWIEFYKEWADRQDAAEGEYAYALAKLEAYCGRFALMMAVADKQESPYRKEEVNESHVRRAFSLVRWFAYEAERVYKMLRTDPREMADDRLVGLIRRRGDKITPRELQRSNPNRYESAADAEKVLETLVSRKLGEWVIDTHGAQGGRPARVFHLTPDTTETDKT